MTLKSNKKQTSNWAVLDLDREVGATKPNDQRPPTVEEMSSLVANGACLYLPPSVLSMPIPLIDVRIFENAMFVWATIQTPFGSRKPIFGLVRYVSMERLSYGIALDDSDRGRVCIIADVRALDVPDYTRDKLIKKAKEHARSLKKDESYRRQWDQYFDAGVDDCINACQ